MSTEISNKRDRVNSFIENADKIDNNKIFNYETYLKLIKKNNNSLIDFNKFKSISKNIHFSENQILFPERLKFYQ